MSKYDQFYGLGCISDGDKRVVEGTIKDAGAGIVDDPDVKIPMPDNSPVDVANTGKKANRKNTTQGNCNSDNKPMNADSFAHRS